MSNYLLNPNQTNVEVKLCDDKTSEVQFYDIHMKVYQDRHWTVRKHENS